MGLLSWLFGSTPALPEPQEGERYVLLSYTPFPRPAITCEVMGVLNGWVRYQHVSQRTNQPYRDAIPCDQPVARFLRAWKRIP